MWNLIRRLRRFPRLRRQPWQPVSWKRIRRSSPPCCKRSEFFTTVFLADLKKWKAVKASLDKLTCSAKRSITWNEGQEGREINGNPSASQPVTEKRTKTKHSLRRGYTIKGLSSERVVTWPFVLVTPPSPLLASPPHGSPVKTT